MVGESDMSGGALGGGMVIGGGLTSMDSVRFSQRIYWQENIYVN
jgi:hypothetical protein